MSTTVEQQIHPNVQWHSCQANHRLDKLVNLIKRIGQINNPNRIIDTFVEGMREIYGARTYISVSTRGLPNGHYQVLRALTYSGVDLFPLYEDADVQPMPLLRRAGIISSLISQPYPRIAKLSPITSDPVFGEHLVQQRSAMVTPIYEGNEVFEWVIVMDQSPDAFSPDDIDNLLVRANMLVLLSENKKMAHQLSRANAVARDEIERIAKIQRALIPQSLPTIQSANFAARYLTYDTAGGDLYDIFPLCNSPGRAALKHPHPFGFIVADASGHGPSAAVLMAMVHAMLHAYPSEPHRPSEILTHLNRHLTAKGLVGTFMTAFLGFYDPGTRVLQYANAGHPPALLRAAPGILQELQTDDGFPLGIIEDSNYDDKSIQLQPTQTLLLYTDGIIDSQSPSGETFGMRGLKKALQRCPGDPDCIIQSGFEALMKHESGIRPNDDQTMLAMQVM